MTASMYGLWTFRWSDSSGLACFGRLPNFGARDARLGRAVRRSCATASMLAGRVADPDRQRRAPVALARQGPIDVRFQKIAEPAVLDVLGQPVDLLVVGQHLVFELRRADEPALARILDQRIFFGPPAERILVQVLLLMIEQPAMPQLARDIACRPP